jgi:hypothetical protein
MSPFRNDIPWIGKFANRVLNCPLATRLVHRTTPWAKGPRRRHDRQLNTPWFDNG